jgi:beta-RFAP synthase
MKVTVKAHARLHFGFIDPDGSSGRKFGSIGLAINEPAVILEAAAADRLSVVGEERGRVLALARRFLRHYDLHQGAHIAVKTTIPPHAGLGSGTQLTLSVASALARLFSINADVRELAAVMGRGGRSGVGIAAFEQGGFIVDAGRRVSAAESTRSPNPVPPTIVRYPFPEDWTFVVAIPYAGRGLAGTAETKAFHKLGGRSAGAVGRLSRILLMQMLPSVLERDPVVFGESLTTIQRIVGAWFRPVQGGTFATTQGAALVKAMSRAGALGVGQSSWGPAVYGLAKDQDQADHLKHQITTAMKGRVEAVVFLANASNRGASIR